MDSTIQKIEDLITGPIAAKIFHIVADHPYGITTNDMAAILYSGSDGGPDYYREAISARICLMNKKLAQLGIRIKGGGGPGSKYVMYLRRVR